MGHVPFRTPRLLSLNKHIYEGGLYVFVERDYSDDKHSGEDDDDDDEEEEARKMMMMMMMMRRRRRRRWRLCRLLRQRHPC